MSNNQDLNEEVSNSFDTSVDYEKLKDIGAQRIHEQTHIPKAQCEDLVNGYFGSMNRIQFLGFVSILEREYSFDLGYLRAEGLEHFSHIKEVPTIESEVFITPKNTKSYTKYYVLAAIIIFFFVLTGVPSSNGTQEHRIDNENIEQVTSQISTQDQEMQEVATAVEEEPQIVMTELKIIPRTKLWVGYINLNTGKKYQKIVDVTEELALDPTGHWLLSLGHGHVDFSVNGELDTYKDYRSIRFLYEYGELKKLTHAEFLALNKGQEW